MATETRTPNRSRYSLTSMVLSIAIVVGIVVAFVVLLPRPHYNSVLEIDPTTAIHSAQRVAPYHVLVPTGLPSGWRATSARVTGPDEHHVVEMHIGYVTPRGAYAALEESNADAIPFIELESAHGRFQGQVVINGQTWDKRFATNQNDYAIDRTNADGSTVVVSGSSVDKSDPYAELVEFAGSLR